MKEKHLIPVLINVAAIIFFAAGYGLGTHNLGYWGVGLFILVGFCLLWMIPQQSGTNTSDNE